MHVMGLLCGTYGEGVTEQLRAVNEQAGALMHRHAITRT